MTKINNKSALIECISQKIPPPLHSIIPEHWFIIGDVLILQIAPSLQPYQDLVAFCFLEHIPNIRIVAKKTGPTKSWQRVPSIQMLAGMGPTETLHKENGCLFKIDPFKLLFSPGNRKERQYLPTTVKENEIIVDMFACVGQFSIPIAVKAQPQHVYAIEKNPIAFHYLKENVTLNKVPSIITPLLGDASSSTPQKIADQVIMGLIPPDPLDYLPQALAALRGMGIIHFHASYPASSIEATLESRLELLHPSIRKHIQEYNIRFIKKYSPKISHIVAELTAQSLDPKRITLKADTAFQTGD